jgi:hypothetical protein
VRSNRVPGPTPVARSGDVARSGELHHDAVHGPFGDAYHRPDLAQADARVPGNTVSWSQDVALLPVVTRQLPATSAARAPFVSLNYSRRTICCTDHVLPSGSLK